MSERNFVKESKFERLFGSFSCSLFILWSFSFSDQLPVLATYLLDEIILTLSSNQEGLLTCMREFSVVPVLLSTLQACIEVSWIDFFFPIGGKCRMVFWFKSCWYFSFEFDWLVCQNDNGNDWTIKNNWFD